jgi:hypothetical protein
VRYSSSLCAEIAPLARSRNQPLKAAIILFPVAFLIGVALLKMVAPGWYSSLVVREDSPGEYLTSLVYFVSFLFAAAIAATQIRMKQRALAVAYAILTLGLIFVAMEEISWGQRLFAIETPESLAARNLQRELTLHNLEGFPLRSLYIIVGLYGAFATLLVPGRIKARHGEIVAWLAPHPSLFGYFFIPAALHLYQDYLSPIAVALFGDGFAWGEGRFIRVRDQEAAELLLSFGFLLFVMMNRCRQLQPALRHGP